MGDKLGMKVKVRKVKQEDLKMPPDYIVKTAEPFYSHGERVNSNNTEGGIVYICNKCSNTAHKSTSTCNHCCAIMLEKYGDKNNE
jgi:hypothetical protein